MLILNATGCSLMCVMVNMRDVCVWGEGIIPFDLGVT